MSKFRNTTTGVVVSVDDSKDSRFDQNWESADKPAAAKKATAKKASSSSKKS